MSEETRVLRFVLRPVCWAVGHRMYPLLAPKPNGWLCTRCHKRRYWHEETSDG